MIENLVDAWLTEASERSYEAAFSQILVIEDHRVVQGPMHHAYEHGKDIIAWNPKQELCVYQLKGGRGTLGKAVVAQIQDQLFTAAATAVSHPSLTEDRSPDRVYLVTNQAVTGPAKDHIRALSVGNVGRDLASLHLIERDELKSRFVAAQGRFFPSDPAALSAFLTLFLADGRGELPRWDFFRFLEQIFPGPDSRVGPAGAARAIAAAALTTAFALRRWAEVDNHAEMAMGWSCYITQVLRMAETKQIDRTHWEQSYRMALEETRRHTRRLLEEARGAEDLLVPDMAEPIVHRARVVKVCGLVSALAVSERIEFGVHRPDRERAGALVLRELGSLQVCGEVEAPDFFLSILAVAEAGQFRKATDMLLGWVAQVARVNRYDSESPLPDPYHGVEEILVHKLFGEGGRLSDEDFNGRAYTVQIGVRWVVRRLWRQALNGMREDVSRIEHCSVEPKRAEEYLAPESGSATMRSWYYPRPTSWFALREEVETCDYSELPEALTESPEFVPFYCLALPYRFNAIVADLLDHLASGRRAGGGRCGFRTEESGEMVERES